MKRILAYIIVLILICIPVTAFAGGTQVQAQETVPVANSGVSADLESSDNVKTDSISESKPSDTDTSEDNDEGNSAQPSGDNGEDVPAPVVSPGQLYIDSDNLYPGMDKTYKEGYIPAATGGKVVIILPLLGETKTEEVTLTADLGMTTDSPFVFGNYAQTAKGGEPYVFTLAIPLAQERINGIYPVTLTASYIDENGSLMTQTFIIYVTITDGKDPVDPNAIPDMGTRASGRETVRKPELFISSCDITPDTVGGNEEFSVKVTVENIGDLKAKSIRLSYSGAAVEGTSPGIIPVESNNSIHLENIAPEKSEEASFKLKTTEAATSGSQPFLIALDYVDAYGGEYTSERSFLITVERDAEMQFDDILKSVPEKITAGETFSLPANVYNTGKSTLKNVMVTVTGAGLFPSSAVFLGDIAPGTAGNGELSVFVGQLSMTEGYTEDYGKTKGIYAISYTDESGEDHKTDVEFKTEILQPVIEEEEEKELTEEPAFQWWVMILVGAAIIAVIVSIVVVTKVTRDAKMK